MQNIHGPPVLWPSTFWGFLLQVNVHWIARVSPRLTRFSQSPPEADISKNAEYPRAPRVMALDLLGLSIAGKLTSDSASLAPFGAFFKVPARS
jgi:hypothetical protein